MQTVQFKIGLIAVAISLAAASCGGGNNNSSNNSGGNTSGSEKFNGTYKYNPPTDNYYIQWTNTWKYDGGNKTKTETNFVACIGKGYSFNSTEEGITYIDFSTGKGWSRLVDGSEWFEDDYDYSDTEDASSAIGPLSAMEEYFLRYFRAFGYEDEQLTEYYVGKEKVAGVNCWMFDSKGLNAITMKYWIDPANGCCLKYQNTETGNVTEVTEYNLNYKSWTNNLQY